MDVKYDAYPGYPHWSWTFPSKSLAERAGKSLATFSGLFNGLWLKRHKARNKSIGERVGEKEKLLLLQLA